jgi:hypothetical protein
MAQKQPCKSLVQSKSVVNPSFPIAIHLSCLFQCGSNMISAMLFFELDGPPQGYISSLIVLPEYRGRGISKALLFAAEGVANQWALDGVASIRLHCDADPGTGRIAQALYTSVRYTCQNTTVLESRPPSSLSSLSSPTQPLASSGVTMINGEPYLYLQKELTVNPTTLQDSNSRIQTEKPDK